MFLWLVLVAYSLVGAVMVLQGKEFNYLILGRTLRRYLERTS
jgi:hypothetical protein